MPDMLSDRLVFAEKRRVEEGKLLIACMAYLLWNLCFVRKKLSGDIIFLDVDRVHHTSLACNKIECTL